MSSKDYEQLCSELDNTRQKDHPRVYDTLSQEEREVLQYWIEHTIQPALKADEHYSSYGLKHEYERETKLYGHHPDNCVGVSVEQASREKRLINLLPEVHRMSISIMPL